MGKMSSSNYETPPSSSSELTTMMDETAASCLMLLSKVGEWSSTFDCKTCGKVFSTFQALGGHRASHKKQKLDQADQSSPIPSRPRSHKCPICGAEFALGQALGGHMRRHRGSAAVSNKRVVCLDLSLNLTPSGKNDDLKLQLGKRDFEMKKSTDLERLQEYDLRMQMGKRRRYGDVFLGLVA